MNKGRILVVEDDLDIANMLRIYFDSQGYEVHVAGRGGDALELCRKKLPHVIVLDIMLPDMDGYEVCKKLRSNLRTRHVPIMFLTQRDERSDKIAGLEGERQRCFEWTVECDYPDALILVGDYLVAGGRDAVAAYRASDGVEVWSREVDGVVKGLAAARGRLFASTDTRKIYCFQ